MKRYVAEVLGTFALVFCGTGAVVINTNSHGALGMLGIAAAFGLVVTAMIYAVGEISGCHLNPAVTIGFCVAGLFKWKDAGGYIVAQIAGAFAASLLLRYLFPADPDLGSSLPSGSNMQAFIMELVLTFFLMFVIIFTTNCSKAVGTLAGLAIGATLMLDVLLGGTVSGGSMNPARSIAPAVVSGNTGTLWIYIAAPIIGACLATAAWKGLGIKKEC